MYRSMQLAVFLSPQAQKVRLNQCTHSDVLGTLLSLYALGQHCHHWRIPTFRLMRTCHNYTSLLRLERIYCGLKIQWLTKNECYVCVFVESWIQCVGVIDPLTRSISSRAIKACYWCSSQHVLQRYNTHATSYGHTAPAQHCQHFDKIYCMIMLY